MNLSSVLLVASSVLGPGLSFVLYATVIIAGMRFLKDGTVGQMTSTFYTLGSFNGCVWAIYSVLIESKTLAIPNAFSLLATSFAFMSYVAVLRKEMKAAEEMSAAVAEIEVSGSNSSAAEVIDGGIDAQDATAPLGASSAELRTVGVLSPLDATLTIGGPLEAPMPPLDPYGSSSKSGTSSAHITRCVSTAATTEGTRTHGSSSLSGGCSDSKPLTPSPQSALTTSPPTPRTHHDDHDEHKYNSGDDVTIVRVTSSFKHHHNHNHQHNDDRCDQNATAEVPSGMVCEEERCAEDRSSFTAIDAPDDLPLTPKEHAEELRARYEYTKRSAAVILGSNAFSCALIIAVCAFGYRGAAIGISGTMGVIMENILFTGPLDEISWILKHKNSAPLDPLMTFVGAVDCAVWIVYALVTGDVYLFIPNVFSVTLCLIQLGLIVRFPARHV